MLMIMDRITDKKDWEEKIFNEEITTKWRVELVNYYEDIGDDENDSAENDDTDHGEEDKADKWKSREITKEMIDWVSFN